MLLGGGTPRAIARAARHDGWIGVHRHLDATAAAVRALRDARGDDPRPFEIAVVAIGGAAEVPALTELGVDRVILPALGLGGGPDVDGLVDAVLRFGERWSTSDPGGASPSP